MTAADQTSTPDSLSRWLEALHARHVAPYRPPEFTKALRALSARYVERRHELPERSALDSAGKRSAFAAFYAPLHYLTVSEIVAALPERARRVTAMVDLGCGTGVGSAAWANQCERRPVISGVDLNAWALEEAKWNWQALGLGGRAQRGDMVAAASSVPSGPAATNALIFAWSINELPREARTRLLQTLTSARERRPVLVVEPLAKGAAPWWNEWTKALAPLGARVDEWKFRVELPPMLKELSHRAGFQRDYLGARTIWLSPE